MLAAILLLVGGCETCQGLHELVYRPAQQSRMREFLRHMAGPGALMGTPLAPEDAHG